MKKEKGLFFLFWKFSKSKRRIRQLDLRRGYITLCSFGMKPRAKKEKQNGFRQEKNTGES